MLWGLHCAPFVSLLGTFVASLEHLGQSWGTLWDTWVSIETSSGRLGTALEILRPPETPSQAEGSQVPRLRTKIEGGSQLGRFRAIWARAGIYINKG